MNIKDFAGAIMRGIDGISLYERHDYYRHVPTDIKLEQSRRWYRLGKRLTQAGQKILDTGKDSR